MMTIEGYTIGTELGRGGMSVVYEAVHDMLKTRHAIKVLDVPTDSENGKTLAAKFLAEARILATLRHPNIIRVTDFGTLEDGRVYFVMDHVEGGSLAERLASGDPPSTSAVRAWYAAPSRSVTNTASFTEILSPKMSLSTATDGSSCPISESPA